MSLVLTVRLFADAVVHEHFSLVTSYQEAVTCTCHASSVTWPGLVCGAYGKGLCMGP